MKSIKKMFKDSPVVAWGLVAVAGWFAWKKGYITMLLSKINM